MFTCLFHLEKQENMIYVLFSLLFNGAIIVKTDCKHIYLLKVELHISRAVRAAYKWILA